VGGSLCVPVLIFLLLVNGSFPDAWWRCSKKQKTQGPEADQSIDALNDVTAVSGVNLRVCGNPDRLTPPV
jgi:hypothetical protein